MKVLKFVILFFLSSCSLFAQNEATDTTKLGEIIVRENRLQMPFREASRSIVLITKQEIQNYHVNSVAELLSFVSGVDIRQRGVTSVQGDVSLRGGTFDQTLVLLNGIKVADPQTGHHLLNLPITLDQIERIEILKGAGSRIFGQNAFTGAINIVTKPDTEGVVRAGATLGGFDFQSFNAAVSLPVGDKFSQTFSFNQMTSAGHRPNSDFYIQNWFYQNQFKLSNGQISIFGGRTRRHFGASGFYSSTNVSDEYERITTHFAALTGDFALKNWSIRPRLSWRDNADEYLFRRNDPNFFRNFTKSGIFTTEIHASNQNKFGITGFTLEHAYTDFKSTRLDTHSRVQWLGMVEHRFTWRGLDVTPGVTFAWYGNFGAQAFPGVDVGYRINKKIKVFANYGRTFRIPTYTDLYFNNAANLNNPALQPEIADNYEGGIKFNTEGVALTATYFNRQGRSIIDRVRSNISAPWQPLNLNEVNAKGIEFQADITPTVWIGGKGQLATIEKIAFGVTYLSDFTARTDIISRYALDIARFQTNFNLIARIGVFYPTFTWRHVERVGLPTYNILDVRLMWRNQYADIFAQVNNLNNITYSESNNIPMPSRWFMVGGMFKLKWK
jgi:iron complex outermembrane receptor protein